MNNIEQIIVRLKTRVALAELIGPDEMIVSASDLSALIAQLEAAQKERDDLREKVNQADSEWHKMADRILSAGKRAEKAEAALSAANEKLKAEQVPVDTGIFTRDELALVCKARVRDMPENYADHQIAKVALRSLFTAPQKPVVLSSSTVMSRAYVVQAIKAAGFTVEE